MTRHRSLTRARARPTTAIAMITPATSDTISSTSVKPRCARAATTSFHEQVRLTTVEQSVRNAANRLRYDLTKVAFMGTGNITLAAGTGGQTIPYGHRVAVNGVGQAGLRYPAAMTNLQGIRVRVGASKAGTEGTLALATNNGLDPDAIVITGNLTSDDQYVGTWSPAPAGACGGGQVRIQRLADHMNARLLGETNNITVAAQNVANVFTPVAGTQFLARVVDDGGCQHFVTVQDATAQDPNTAIINLCQGNDNTSVLLGHADPGDTRLAGPVGTGCGIDPNGAVRINPLHRVEWYIGPNTQPLLSPPPAIGGATEQFMLYRAFHDANGNRIPQMTQVVAEYAIDLKFGIVVDDPAQAAPNNIRVFDLDSDMNGEGGGGPIDTWTRPSSQSATNQPGPQRVRSVKFRVSSRAALPDRTANLAVLPGTPYITRYCVENAPPASCTKFSRVRTIVSEVALINQARMTY